MSNNFFNYLNIINKKKFKFKETYTVTYISKKNFFDYNSFFILPFKTKIKFLIFFCFKKNNFKNSYNKYIFFDFNEKIFNNNFFKKKYRYYFFDSFSFKKLKKLGLLKIFIRKKKKFFYNYGFYFDEFERIFKILKENNFLFFDINKKNNFVNFSFSTTDCNIDSIFKNFIFINKSFFNLLKKKGYNVKNIKKIVVSTTQKNKFLITDDECFFKNKK
ncbi:hypothetical protein ACWNYQ_00020 [Candidatus Vidania fulgoroideorum]